MEIILVVALILLWIGHSNLQARVKKLEGESFSSSTSSKASDIRPAPALMYDIPKEEMVQTPKSLLPDFPVSGPASEPAIETWLKQDPLVKIGALFFLIGIGWFVSYAFANNWIGPVGRVMLGLLIGLLFMIGGTIRIKTYAHQGAIFTVLGSTVILLTVFAARAAYEYMFTPPVALSIMFLSIVYVTFVSLVYSRQQMAVAGLVLAGLAPYLLSVPSSDLFQTVSYLLIIVLGTLWVVYVTGWRNLTVIALVITAVHTLPFINSTESEIGLLWAFVFTAIFFVTNLVSMWRQSGMELLPVQMLTALGVALYLLLWIAEAAPTDLQSLLFVTWALVFSVGSYCAYRFTGSQAPFYVYASAALVYLGVATAAELSGPTLNIAYTLEITALVLLSTYLGMPAKVTRTLTALFVLPIILSVESVVSSAWMDSVFHDDAANLFILTLSLLLTGLYTMLYIPKESEDDLHLGQVLIIVASSYLVVLVWLVTHALLAYDTTAVTVSLLIYIITGIILYFKGLNDNDKNIKVAGGILIGLVVGRLLLIDVWSMDLTWRIITFIVIGSILISTAFINKIKK